MAIYGIDLGTTNSLIGLHSEHFLSPTVPSCVNMETGEAGATMFDNMNAERSFKTDMSMGVEGIIPRVASKFVLKECVNQVPKNLPKVEEVVISVPAYFSDSHRTATIAAAEDAGLKVVSLVNEPTAAAMYIAKDKKGLFVVYDLGGGTFDVSIIDSRFGTFDVQATSGCPVGGDNFDATIMKYFVKEGRIPIQKMNALAWSALKHFTAKQKVILQKAESAIEVDLSPWNGQRILFTVSTYEQLMKMTFSQTLTCMQKLVRQWIPENEVYEILLVGGSTHCPYLRRWIEDTTGRMTAPLTYNPDYVVAQGAALYADIYANGAIETKVSDVTKELSIGLYDGTVSVVVPGNSKIPLSMEKVFSNPIDASELCLDLYQGESMFIKDNELIGSLVWPYERLVPAGTGQVIVTINIDASGVINFSANELLKTPKVVVLNRNKKDS